MNSILRKQIDENEPWSLLGTKILETLELSDVVTYLVQAPPYVIAYIATVVISWSSGRNKEHCFHIIIPIVFGLAGAFILISTLDIGARYFGIILLCNGPFVGLNVRLNLRSTHERMRLLIRA